MLQWVNEKHKTKLLRVIVSGLMVHCACNNQRCVYRVEQSRLLLHLWHKDLILHWLLWFNCFTPCVHVSVWMCMLIFSTRLKGQKWTISVLLTGWPLKCIWCTHSSFLLHALHFLGQKLHFVIISGVFSATSLVRQRLYFILNTWCRFCVELSLWKN